MRSSQRWTKASDWELAPLSPCLSRRFNKVIFCRMIPLLKVALKKLVLLSKVAQLFGTKIGFGFQSFSSTQTVPSTPETNDSIKNICVWSMYYQNSGKGDHFKSIPRFRHPVNKVSKRFPKLMIFELFKAHTTTYLSTST